MNHAEGKSKFVLVINLGNEAMQTATDVMEALRTVAAQVEQAEGNSIKDDNGNKVGSWCFED